MTTFKLRFPKREVRALAERYGYEDDGDVLEAGKCSREAGFYTLADFLQVCDWKTRRRPRRHYERNSAVDVRRATALSLSSTDEETRLWSLVCPNLIGVQMPTASALLHVAANDPTRVDTASSAYPIIDFRALWSLTCETRHDTFDFWWGYVLACRTLAVECGVSMRELDRALWQYSKENQRKEVCC